MLTLTSILSFAVGPNPALNNRNKKNQYKRGAVWLSDLCVKCNERQHTRGTKLLFLAHALLHSPLYRKLFGPRSISSSCRVMVQKGTAVIFSQVSSRVTSAQVVETSVTSDSPLQIYHHSSVYFVGKKTFPYTLL